MEELPTLWQRTGLDADSSAMAPEVTTLNQRKTVDPRFLRIEFEGWFVAWQLLKDLGSTVSLTTWTEQ